MTATELTNDPIGDELARIFEAEREAVSIGGHTELIRAAAHLAALVEFDPEYEASAFDVLTSSTQPEKDVRRAWNGARSWAAERVIAGELSDELEHTRAMVDALDVFADEYEPRPKLRVVEPPPAEQYGAGLDLLGFVTQQLPAQRALWGTDDVILHASGESLMLFGEPGSSKSTNATQLAFGLVGIPGFEELLGFPVHAIPGGRLLILAMDRPRQLVYSVRRQIDDATAARYANRVQVRQGPLPSKLVQSDDMLVALADHYGANVILLDSLKDVHNALDDPRQAGQYNGQRQRALAEGIEIIELHHARKNKDSKESSELSLSKVYGGMPLTAGAGTVIGLEPTAIIDPRLLPFRVRQLKSAKFRVSTFDAYVDLETGRSHVGDGAWRERIMAAIAPGPVSTGDIARALNITVKSSEYTALRRELKKLVDADVLDESKSSQGNTYSRKRKA